MSDNKTGLALLRDDFPENQISYLPKGGVKLAYVGHAALTDRLLNADLAWSWEPLALDARGLPALDEIGGLWIKLTICGVTRLGYGDAGEKKGANAMKERIGDALRNAAMRFGAALALWHKGELHAHEEEAPPPKARTGVMADVLATMPKLSAEQQDYINELAMNVIDLHRTKGQGVAFDRVESEQLDNEQRIFLWDKLPSNVRSALKTERGLRIGAA